MEQGLRLLEEEPYGLSEEATYLLLLVPLLRGLVVLYVFFVFVSCWCFLVPRLKHKPGKLEFQKLHPRQAS